MPDTLVVGAGEIGLPLADLLSLSYEVHVKDLEDLEVDSPFRWLHICYPFDEVFVDSVEDYFRQYRPLYIMVHSTVSPGTTNRIQERVSVPVYYSPVRGRHLFMRRDLMRYTKFVAGDNLIDAARLYLQGAHFQVATMSCPTALELAKLVETSYTVLLIAWAQELERFSQDLGVDRREVLQFTKEVDWLPRHLFYPGHIQGHCLIPNAELLASLRESGILEAVLDSNEQAVEWHDGERHSIEEL